MWKSLKVGGGTALFAAPILLGFGLTDATVGTGGGRSHNVDQWVISQDDSGEYTIDREELNGEVSIVVTNPDGVIVLADELPPFVADAVDGFGPDWVPPEHDLVDFVDGTPCYHVDRLDDAIGDDDGEFGMTVSSDDDGTFAIKVSPDGTRDMAYFEEAIPETVLDDHREAGGTYGELEGAQPLVPCN